MYTFYTALCRRLGAPNGMPMARNGHVEPGSLLVVIELAVQGHEKPLVTSANGMLMACLPSAFQVRRMASRSASPQYGGSLGTRRWQAQAAIVAVTVAVSLEVSSTASS